MKEKGDKIDEGIRYLRCILRTMVILIIYSLRVVSSAQMWGVRCPQYLEGSPRLPGPLDSYLIIIWLSVNLDLFSFWIKGNLGLRKNEDEQKWAWNKQTKKDDLRQPTVGGFSFSVFHFMALFWKASLLNYHKSIGCYLDNLHFPRVVSSFITLEIYLLLHPSCTVRHPSQISRLDHTDSSFNTATYKLYTEASSLTTSSKVEMIKKPSLWAYYKD